MLSFIDCQDMSDLRPDEILTIARHLHVPEIVAVEIGAGLRRTWMGEDLLERLMRTADESNVYKARHSLLP
ncbi:hypothetical protein [Rhodopila globiformis]|uniref:Uncharacterized protein n=1 Tax=Rhodopila globiformis TaxID=1071 RepID=A0A2S6N8I4_RHOGL|nr:hypothetical protein [Rhodopila globiformis]PPQ30926.1 hypothetical protein CCS01_18420 [Rhodopila globiformis]